MRTVSWSDTGALAPEDTAAGVSAVFSVLGVGIRVKGSPAADIAPVVREYSAFRSDNLHPSLTITWDGHASPTRLTVNGTVYLCVPGDSVSPIISTRIMDHVYATAGEFFLFHGAAAACQGTLLAFPGQSGTGKSSQAMSLAMRGWTLFSDEVIAVAKEDLKVRPFPRAITVWESSPALEEFVVARRGCAESAPLLKEHMKAIIPFSSFNQPPTPLPLKAIMCLRGGRRERRKGGGQIVVTYWDERMEKLAREKGIHDGLCVKKIEEFWLIKSDRMELVEDICTSLGGLVIQRELVKDSQPVFGKAPLLEPISPSECLGALWSVFENGRRLANCDGGVAALYLKLARVAKTVPCFWLRPGLPSATCELLQNLAQRLEENSQS